MKILAIETSCDETSVAILNSDKNKLNVLCNLVSSQTEIHKEYGGVVPCLAAREHIKNFFPILDKAFEESKIKKSDVDLLAVTAGPGLIPALLIGVNIAKTLAWLWEKPIVPVNHLEAHIYANFIENSNVQFPALALVVSGGHTLLTLIRRHLDFKLLGETKDDAAGEAFDKVARILGLGYPGGPYIQKEAEKGNPTSFNFPRPMINSGDYNFSFSGLKTSVLYKVKELKNSSSADSRLPTASLAASFQQAVIDVLVKKTIKAAKEYRVKSLLLGGGVMANKPLREKFELEAEKINVSLFIPAFQHTTDNAAMIAVAAHYRYTRARDKSHFAWRNVKAEANLKL